MFHTRRVSSPATRHAPLATLLLLCHSAVAAPPLLDVPAPDGAVARVEFVDEQKQPRLFDGRIVQEASDGGLLLLAPNGRIWSVAPERITAKAALETEFAPLAADALAAPLQAEFGPGFAVYPTKHFLICTNTDKAYALWSANLFERLHVAFHAHWKARGIALREPEFPLQVVIFRDAAQFGKYATADAGPEAAGAKGYYSLATNRVALYDLAGTGGARPQTPDDIAARLEAAPFNIATVVHEATHQIAFNSGLQARYADNPLWLSEGMAMFFETPDLRGKSGWKTAGAVNKLRLRQFLDYADKRRPADSLAQLVASNARFQDGESAGDAYAESWALFYYLSKHKSAELSQYLAALARKQPLLYDEPETRLVEFRVAFGDDLAALDAAFLRTLRKMTRLAR